MVSSIPVQARSGKEGFSRYAFFPNTSKQRIKCLEQEGKKNVGE